MLFWRDAWHALLYFVHWTDLELFKKLILVLCARVIQSFIYLFICFLIYLFIYTFATTDSLLIIKIEPCTRELKECTKALCLYSKMFKKKTTRLLFYL